MKVNFNQQFKDFNGNSLGVTIMHEIGKTLFNLATLNNNPLTPDEKYMAYKLCDRISKNGEVDINAEEAAFLIKVCGEHMTAGGYGQVRDLIEG